MKSFLKEIESKFAELNEKDWDGDGTEESPEDEYMGVKDKAIKKAMKKEDIKNPGKYKTGMKAGYDKDGDGVPNGADTDPEDGSVTEADIVVKPEDIDTVKQKIDSEEDRLVVEDELEEISTSGGVAAYQTPYAFSTKAQAKKKKKMKYASVQEAMDQKYAKLIESYSKFALGKGAKSSPSRTVNETIRDVAKKLQEIETLINYTGRLKNESGMTRAEYGKSTHTALNKISERLLKISERVRRLGE